MTEPMHSSLPAGRGRRLEEARRLRTARAAQRCSPRQPAFAALWHLCPLRAVKHSRAERFCASGASGRLPRAPGRCRAGGGCGALRSRPGAQAQPLRAARRVGERACGWAPRGATLCCPRGAGCSAGPLGSSPSSVGGWQRPGTGRAQRGASLCALSSLERAAPALPSPLLGWRQLKSCKPLVNVCFSRKTLQTEGRSSPACLM